MRQMTLAQQAEFQRYSKKTRQEQFLEEMDAVMPWAELLALVAPYYSKGEMGRKPVGLAMLSYGPSTQRSSEQPVMPEIRPGL